MLEYPVDLAVEAARIVKRATGFGVNSVHPILSGYMTFKLTVTTDAGSDYIVRIYPKGREHIARFEPGLLIRLHDMGAAVPKVLCWSDTDPALPYLVYEKIAGDSLDRRLHHISMTELERVCLQMSEQLKILSELSVEGYGELLDAKHAGHTSWCDFIAEVVAAPISAVSTDRTLLVEARTALQSLTKRPAADVMRSLVWTDISPENIIVDADNRFAGLIDFEGTMALEPEATLGYLEARYYETPFHLLCRKVMPIESDRRYLPAFYAVVRALRLQPYLPGALPAGGSRDPLDKFLPGLEYACRQVIEWGEAH